MSKRYGRQRKRQAEARLKEAQDCIVQGLTELAAERAKLARCTAALNEQRREMELVRSTLEDLLPFTVMLPPKDLGEGRMDDFELALPPPRPRLFDLQACSRDLAEPLFILRVRVHELKAWVEKNRERLQLAVHVRCGNRYFLSTVAQSLLEQVPEARRQVAQSIIRDIFYQFTAS